MKHHTILSKIPDTLRHKVKKRSEPSFIKPMLATLTKDYFSSDDWIYEEKFDGERCLAFKKDGVVRLMSRNKKNMNDIYPELVAALTKQSADNFIIDGEIVSLNKKGISDFELLQGRMNLHAKSSRSSQQQNIAIVYNIFDLLYIDGYDICALPLLTRKELLKPIFHYNNIVAYTQHIVGKGIPFFKKACKLHWEGLIAKKSNSLYISRRSHDWLKFKCIMKQELVIGAYTTPQGSRAYFGALLVGYYEQGKLQYAGKVGTGYSRDILAMLGKKLHKLETKKCPFDSYTGSAKNIHWVKPVIVAEFQFAQWTNAGRLRVGRYKGLRDDKAAKDVVKETPKAIGIQPKAKVRR